MIDLHLHTTASDGRLAPAELMARASGAGLTTVSVTDHDTTSGIAEARDAAARLGIRFVTGIEITAVEQGRDVHVLGYFFDAGHRALAAFLRGQRADRVRRVREMADRLRALGYHVDIEPAIAAAGTDGGRSIGRPLLADALVSAGHVAEWRDAFERLLGSGRPAFVARRGAPVAEVVAIIHLAGGVASLAHPGLTRLDDEIARFAGSGLTALEVRHSDHDRPTEDRYRQLASSLGLAVSGGSDFHGDPRQHRNTLGLVALPAPDFEELRSRAARAPSAARPRG